MWGPEFKSKYHQEGREERKEGGREEERKEGRKRWRRLLKLFSIPIVSPFPLGIPDVGLVPYSVRIKALLVMCLLKI
jgi:hypothetical protein